MKILIPIFLLVALVGCASPFRTVYTSPDGDHYIEERAVQGGYYVPDSVLYAGIGFDPWWITVNPSLAFIYYNPSYYPYYLSAWYRLVYQPFYGYYPGYYSYWCPPYRMRDGLPPGHAGRIAHGTIPATFIHGREITNSRDLQRSAEYKSYNPAVKPGMGPAYRAPGQNRSPTAFGKAPVKPSWSAPGTGMSRSSGFASPSSRSITANRSLKTSNLPIVRDKQ
ncbi:hypothetical protein ACFL00_04965 [Pseudomonadota bacterium]